MPDVLSQDDSPLSFMPGSPMLAPPPPAPPMAPQPVASGGAAAPAPPGAPNLQDIISKASGQGDAAIAEAQKSQAAEIAAIEAKAKAQQPYVDKALAAAQQPIMQPPKLERPPAAPKGRDQHADENWLFAASILGSLAGAFTRNHATNALAAFSGAMEGYNEGNKQKIAENMKIWEAENKRVQETNQEAMSEYKAALENRKFSVDQMSTAIELAGMKYNDQAAIEVAKTKNSLIMAQYFDKRADAAEKMKAAVDQHIERREDAQERNRQRELDRQARIDAQKARLDAGRLSEDGIDMRAEMALQGNPLAMRGLRAGSPDLAAVTNRMAEKGRELGLSVEDITKRQTQFVGEQAYQRVAGTQAARVESATNEVVTLAPQAVEASHALPRGAMGPLNKIIQEGIKVNIPTQGEFDIFLGQKQLSDPRYYDFLVANFSLGTAYGRAMNPQGVPRVTETEARKALNMLSTTTSPEAYDTQVRRLLLEVKASQEAQKRTREGVQGGDNIDQLINRLGLKPVQKFSNRLERVTSDDPLAAMQAEQGTRRLSGKPPTPDMPIELPKGWTMQPMP